MATKILMKHTQTGKVKTGAYGFSWTYLVFGAFVPLFRGEIRIGLLHLLFSIFLLFGGLLLFEWLSMFEQISGVDVPLMIWGCLFLGLFLIFELWRLIIGSIHNKQYMLRMLMDGWELAGTDDENLKAKTALDID